MDARDFSCADPGESTTGSSRTLKEAIISELNYRVNESHFLRSILRTA